MYRRILFILLRTRIGKIGIALIAVPAIQLVFASFLPAHATESNLSAADNTLILKSSALVLLMTPGIALIYGGLHRKKCF